MGVYLYVVNSVLSIICLNLSVAVGISTFDARLENSYLYCSRFNNYLVILKFKEVGNNICFLTIFVNCRVAILFSSKYSVLFFNFSFLHCLMSCIAVLFR